MKSELFDDPIRSFLIMIFFLFRHRMEKLKKRSQLIDSVRRDYAHIMELRTILELQRLRTYPTLGPNPDHCMK